MSYLNPAVNHKMCTYGITTVSAYTHLRDTVEVLLYSLKQWQVRNDLWSSKWSAEGAIDSYTLYILYILTISPCGRERTFSGFSAPYKQSVYSLICEHLFFYTSIYCNIQQQEYCVFNNINTYCSIYCPLSRPCIKNLHVYLMQQEKGHIQNKVYLALTNKVQNTFVVPLKW